MNSDNNELVFFDENEENENPENPETAEEEDDFSGLVENPYLSQSKIYGLMKDGTDDPDILRRLRERDIKNRILRRKTSHTTGNFALDLLQMLTVSPLNFKVGWKTFLEFYNLGKYKPDEDGSLSDIAECDKLYQRKKGIFWASIITGTFLKPAALEALILVVSWFWLRSSVASINGFFLKHPIKTLWVLIAFEVLWNSFKIFLRSILNVMRATCDTITAKKKDADKAKKAQKEAKEKAKKAREEARKEARKNAEPQSQPEGQQPSGPIRPSDRRRSHSGG